MQGAALNSLSPPRPSRWRAATTVAAAVLAAHLLLLKGPHTGHRPGSRDATLRPLQVRQIQVPATGAAVLAIPLAAAPTAAPAAAPGGAVTAAVARQRPQADPADAPPAPLVGPPTEPAPVRAAVGGGEAATPPAAEAIPSSGGPPLPAYATRLPSAMTLHYTLRQGAASGRAELRWRPTDDLYRLTLDRSAPGQPLQGSTSQGLLVATGVAPGRYTESRRGREQRAVNFQREAGRITFSGPQLQYPLSAGAQDRLSWMVQLPAVLEAEPTLREAGSEVLIFIVGTRGDGEVWAFSVQGREALDLPGGRVGDTLHLRRAPSRPYDTQVDVWLDPALQHMPVRLRLQLHPAGGSTEFTLEQHAAP